MDAITTLVIVAAAVVVVISILGSWIMGLSLNYGSITEDETKTQ